MGVNLIYTPRNMDTQFCMVKYDPLPTENANKFAVIVLDSSFVDLVERTSLSPASKMALLHCWK